MSDPSKANKIPIQKEKTQKMPTKSLSNNKSLSHQKNSLTPNLKSHDKKESLESKSYP